VAHSSVLRLLTVVGIILVGYLAVASFRGDPGSNQFYVFAEASLHAEGTQHVTDCLTSNNIDYRMTSDGSVEITHSDGDKAVERCA
jgi:hypothetical protein